MRTNHDNILQESETATSAKRVTVRGNSTNKTTRTKRESFTIAFRVDAYYLNMLEKGASHYNISTHEFARQQLLQVLDRLEGSNILEATERTRDSVERLREDLATSLIVILINTTRSSDPEKIREWVQTHLRAGKAAR